MSEILDSLFGSKIKTRLLRFFLLNHEGEYSLNEISKKNIIPVVKMRKEINELKRIKFIQEKSKKAGKTYALNEKFCFLEELRNLLAKSNSHAQLKNLEKLRQIGDVRLAMVSGTFLNYPKSKVDLILVANNVSRNKLKQAMVGLEAEVGKEISFVLMNSEEFKYRLDMLDRFILEFLEAPHEELINKIPGLKRIKQNLRK